MATLLQLQKRRDDALAAVKSAKSEDVRDKALEALAVAKHDLDSFKSTLDSKTIKTVKKEERYEEEDESEDEEEDEGAEPKKPMSDDDGDDDDDDDDDGDDDDDDSDDSEEDEDADEDEEEDEEEDEDEDEEARASALAAAKSVLVSAKKSGDKALISNARAAFKSIKSVIKHSRSFSAEVAKVTGRKSRKGSVGALSALKATAASTAKLSADVARIKSQKRREKVDSMLADARRDGKVAKAQVAALRAQGIKDPKWLRGYIDTLPKRVRLIEDGAMQGKDGEKSAASIETQGLNAEQRKAIEQMAQSAGQSFDEFMADMNKTTNSGAARRAQ